MTATRARWTLFTVQSRISALLSRFANTRPAITFTVSRAYFSAVWVDTGVVRGQAFTRTADVLSMANAGSALTGSFARAQQAVMSVTGEVVAFTEVARNHLSRIRSLVAITNTADTVSTSTAIDVGGIVWAAGQIAVSFSVDVLAKERE